MTHMDVRLIQSVSLLPFDDILIMDILQIVHIDNKDVQQLHEEEANKTIFCKAGGKRYWSLAWRGECKERNALVSRYSSDNDLSRWIC